MDTKQKDELFIINREFRTPGPGRKEPDIAKKTTDKERISECLKNHHINSD